jgi:hypothetical protein
MRAFAFATLILASGLVHADWKKDLKDAAQQKASQQVEQKLGIASPAPANASVYFINLKDGDTVTGPVLVQFGLKNAGVAPAGMQKEGTGHFHLLIDGPTVDYTQTLPMTDQIKHYGGGQTETTLTLKPGPHTLQILFADWKHLSFNPAVESAKISITVK